MGLHVQLAPSDLGTILAHVPKDLREVMENCARKFGTLDSCAVFLAGGAIRSILSGEPPSDFDVFSSTPIYAGNMAEALLATREETGPPRASRRYQTGNAITVLTPGRIPVQFISAWQYTDGHDLINDFDFTIAQAAVWPVITDYGGLEWTGYTSREFFHDLARKQLVYLSPVRKEHPGGSLLRMRKFLRRGYNISTDSMATLMARFVKSVVLDRMGEGRIDTRTESGLSMVLKASLREIDPLITLDTVNPADDEPAMAA